MKPTMKNEILELMQRVPFEVAQAAYKEAKAAGLVYGIPYNDRVVYRLGNRGRNLVVQRMREYLGIPHQVFTPSVSDVDKRIEQLADGFRPRNFQEECIGRNLKNERHA